MGKYVRGISMNVENVGKMIKSSKKKYSWEIKIDAKDYRIEYTRSKVSGKDRIMVNGKIVYSHQEYMRKPLNVTFEDEDNVFMIVEFNEVYKLFINSRDFDDYFGHDNVKSILKKSRMEEEADDRDIDHQAGNGIMNINENHMVLQGHRSSPDGARKRSKSNKRVTFNLADDISHPEEAGKFSPNIAQGVTRLRNSSCDAAQSQGLKSSNTGQGYGMQSPETYTAYESTLMTDSMIQGHNIGAEFQGSPTKNPNYSPLMTSFETRTTHQQPRNPQAFTNAPGHSGYFPASSPRGQANHSNSNFQPPPMLANDHQKYGSYHTITDSTSLQNSISSPPQQLPEFPLATPGSQNYVITNVQGPPSNGQAAPHKQSLSDYLSKQMKDGQSSQASDPQSVQGSQLGFELANVPNFPVYQFNAPISAPKPQPMVYQQNSNPPSRTLRNNVSPATQEFAPRSPGFAQGSIANEESHISAGNHQQNYGSLTGHSSYPGYEKQAHQANTQMASPLSQGFRFSPKNH